MRRAAAALAATLVAAGPALGQPMGPGGPHGPVTIQVGTPNPAAVLYGPADMLCDMNKCRMFSLPPENKLAPKTIVVFGYPPVYGQGAIDLRRCLDLCRAAVLGYPSPPTSASEYPGPSVFITPVELRLQ